MKTSVCRGCKERAATCHAECERYKAEWEENRRQDVVRMKEKAADYFSPTTLIQNRAAYEAAKYRKKR